jgi:hypothetical protein
MASASISWRVVQPPTSSPYYNPHTAPPFTVPQSTFAYDPYGYVTSTGSYVYTSMFQLQLQLQLLKFRGLHIHVLHLSITYFILNILVHFKRLVLLHFFGRYGANHIFVEQSS